MSCEKHANLTIAIIIVLAITAGILLSCNSETARAQDNVVRQLTGSPMTLSPRVYEIHIPAGTIYVFCEESCQKLN